MYLSVYEIKQCTNSDCCLSSGTLGRPEDSARLQAVAVYIANLFLLTSDTTVEIIKDIDVDPTTVGQCLLTTCQCC